jgi:hypothetical protein
MVGWGMSMRVSLLAGPKENCSLVENIRQTVLSVSCRMQAGIGGIRRMRLYVEGVAHWSPVCRRRLRERYCTIREQLQGDPAFVAVGIATRHPDCALNVSLYACLTLHRSMCRTLHYTNLPDNYTTPKRANTTARIDKQPAFVSIYPVHPGSPVA